MRVLGSFLLLAATATTAHATGYANTGYANTGYANTGYANTGYANTGYANTGYANTGYANTGYANTSYTDAGWTNVPAYGGAAYLNGGTTNNTHYASYGNLAQNQWAQVGYFPVTAGNTIQIVQTGQGDMDLYAKFDAWPNESVFDCRPYTGSANETCTLTVPSGAQKIYVAAKGYTAGSFSIQVKNYDVQVDSMRTSQNQPIFNVQLSGTDITGTAWVYENTPVQECEDPYGCWTTYQPQWNWRTVHAADLVGGAMQETLVQQVDGMVVGVMPLRIAGIHPHSGVDADTTTYTLQAYVNESWQAYCRDPYGAVYDAIPIAGEFNQIDSPYLGSINGGRRISTDPTKVSWGCLNDARGECAAGQSIQGGRGYKPWTTSSAYYKVLTLNCPSTGPCRWDTSWTVTNSTGVDFMACVRMTTADYCGDGHAHTTPGKRLDLWDMLPPGSARNFKDYATVLPKGASWNDNGANDFRCNGRVESKWPHCENSPTPWYCDTVCPTYNYFDSNGQAHSFTHPFDIRDDGTQACTTTDIYNTQQQPPGVNFNHNELVNTNEITWQ